jgi:pyruvate carboxylase
MSGGTAQPNLNTLTESLRHTPRDTQLPSAALDAFAEYWRAVREFYVPFESPVLAAGADLYRHEMPGGQYTNLYEQARALGLSHRWPEICNTYAEVNLVLGDIVKVTPTSKSVGDLALFLIANDMKASDIVEGEREIAYPQSVIDLLDGSMGQPPGGFPEKVQQRILGTRKPLAGRPGESMPPADLEKKAAELAKTLGREPTKRDVLSSLLYPAVFDGYVTHEQNYSDTSVLPTPNFFYGMVPGEEIAVDIEPGKTLITRLLTISEPHEDGRRTVFFELNGQPRDVSIADKSIEPAESARVKADPKDPTHVAAPMPGMVVNLAARMGDKVAKGQKLLTLEAMKMQTAIAAEREGVVREVHVHPGSQVEAGELLLRLE